MFDKRRIRIVCTIALAAIAPSTLARAECIDSPPRSRRMVVGR